MLPQIEEEGFAFLTQQIVLSFFYFGFPLLVD